MLRNLMLKHVFLEKLTTCAEGLPSPCILPIQCFGDCHRIISFLWFAPSLDRMLKPTDISEFCTSLLMKETLEWMLVITADNHAFCKQITSSDSPFLRDFFVSVSFPRNSSWVAGRSRTLTFSSGFSLLRWIVFHSTPVSSSALTCCFSLYAIHTFFLLCPWTCP